MEGIILTDVLRRGGVEVVTASLAEGSVLASRKTTHLADKTLEEVANDFFELILLPGGIEGTKNLQNSELLKTRVLHQKKNGDLIAAICAAPNALRAWGVISGEDPFTAFPTSISLARGGKYKEERIVSHNNVFTSIGPGSAFEFALFLLEKLEGKETRQKVEEGLCLPGSI
jgi:4-methyl-5(b-hydroxyethyl)-thiazole monophosphate biosynthesis